MSDMRLRPAPTEIDSEDSGIDSTNINRRRFMRYGFNAAGGVLAASLGALGFASILLPPGGNEGGDAAVKFWAKGREEEAWYGAMHLQPMTKSSFVSAITADIFVVPTSKAVITDLAIITLKLSYYYIVNQFL